MSLNGLDAPAVQEAYQAAVAESGGWLLLKYATRDSVELYERGKAGVNEARVAVSKYGKQSPLYGLIIYRRRKVLLKYVPEGTSRLLQARTSVHFQDVMERYAPYETLLEFESPDGFSDTALAAVFPLHTASPAISSNRLNEISEDAEEGSPAPEDPEKVPIPPPKTAKERKAERVARAERQRALKSQASSPPPSIQVNGEASPTSSPLASPRPSLAQSLVREQSGQRSISSITSPSVASATEYAGSERSDTNTEPESAPPSKPDLVDRNSSILSPQHPLTDPGATAEQDSYTTSTARPDDVSAEPIHRSTASPEALSESHGKSRPSEEQESSAASLRERNNAIGRSTANKPYDPDDPYDLKKYDHLFKPKTKLGPRLVSQDTKKARPSVPSVAAVPSNVRPQPPKKDPPVRPKSHGPGSIPASQLPIMPAPPPIPDVPEYNPRPISRGSVKSLPSHRSTAMTPDKLRLMKAIELRKKQMRKSQGAEMTGVPKFDADAPEVPKLPEQPAAQETQRQATEQALETPAGREDSPSKKADSGIELDYQDNGKREDKETLELLESPRKEGNMAREMEKSIDASPSPDASADDMADVTPKAKAEGVAAALTSTEASGEDKDGDGEAAAQSSADLARVPTLVEPSGSEADDAPADSRDAGSDTGTREQSEFDGSEADGKDLRPQNSDLAKRRRGYIEPIHFEDMSSDDELAEELSTATVHQARPITVAKSPITESFIRRPSYNSTMSEASDARTETARQRTSSNLAKKDDSPNMSGSADTSPSAERPDGMANLKRNVSSGISQRIQALADSSSRDPSPSGYRSPPRAFSPDSASNLYPGDRSLQNRGSLRPPRSRTSSFQKTARLSARISASQQQQFSGNTYQSENAPIVNVHRDPTTNRDSVSVTARIVRPPGGHEMAGESQQQVNDEPVSTETMSRLSRLDTDIPSLVPNSNPSRSTSPEAKRISQEQSTRAMHSARNHFGRHKQGASAPGTPLSPHPDDFPAPPPSAGHRTQSSTSLASAGDDNSLASTAKEGTRTSRFFKRMSNIATKRRSTAQGSVAGDSVNSNSEYAGAKGKPIGERSADMPPAATVGNLNVQFPDSLLWKRRIVSIDDSGYLCFGIPQAMDHQRGSSKKFPFSDFSSAPYIPDLDRQELPFSVMLDFADGTTLQAACEDAMTHRQVVHVLKSYWKAWHGP